LQQLLSWEPTSDVLDCQWLQQLASCGLLSGAFRPTEQGCALRAVMRQRDLAVASRARHIQHMQKALTQMNLQKAVGCARIAKCQPFQGQWQGAMFTLRVTPKGPSAPSGIPDQG
jgi:hypothetical protein